jgi:hypothetical protein
LPALMAKVVKIRKCAKQYAHIAQSVEHFLGKEEVTGSNPVMSSIPAEVGEGGVKRGIRF